MIHISVCWWQAVFILLKNIFNHLYSWMILLLLIWVLGRELFSVSTLKRSFHCLALFSLRSHLSACPFSESIMLFFRIRLRFFSLSLVVYILIVMCLGLAFYFFLLRIEWDFKFTYWYLPKVLENYQPLSPQISSLPHSLFSEILII